MGITIIKNKLNTNPDLITDSTKVLKTGDTMTGDLNFTNAGLTDLSYIKLDTAAVTILDEGQLHWNEQEKCLQVDGLDTSQPLGQSLWVRVNNNTASTILKGKAVYGSGGLGSRPTIALAQSNSLATSLTFLGLTANDIPAGQDGFVVINGLVDGINTDLYNVGTLLYLSSSVPGGFQTTRPPAPYMNVIVGTVRVKSATVGTIGVLPSVQPFLRSLSDVFAGSPANNDMLKYNSSLLRWETTTADVYSVYTGFVNRTDSTIAVDGSGL